MSDKSKKTPNLDTSARHVEAADKYDESAKALFDWAGDRDVVEVNIDASRSQVADMLRKAAADEREAIAKRFDLHAQNKWIEASSYPVGSRERTTAEAWAVEYQCSATNIRARAKGGA